LLSMTGMRRADTATEHLSTCFKMTFKIVANIGITCRLNTTFFDLTAKH